LKATMDKAMVKTTQRKAKTKRRRISKTREDKRRRRRPFKDLKAKLRKTARGYTVSVRAQIENRDRSLLIRRVFPHENPDDVLREVQAAADDLNDQPRTKETADRYKYLK